MFPRFGRAIALLTAVRKIATLNSERQPGRGCCDLDFVSGTGMSGTELAQKGRRKTVMRGFESVLIQINDEVGPVLREGAPAQSISVGIDRVLGAPLAFLPAETARP